MALLAEEGIGALAATAAATIIAAGLARTIGLADLLFALTGMAFEARLASPTATSAAVVATDLAGTIRLAATSLHTLILLAALALGASPTRTATAVAATDLPIAIRLARTALAAVERLDIGNTLIVPL